jgi:hypothetical protein
MSEKALSSTRQEQKNQFFREMTLSLLFFYALRNAREMCMDVTGNRLEMGDLSLRYPFLNL